MPVNLGPKLLDECRRLGWPVAKTEYFNHYARKRFDLFGCLDYIILDGQPGVLGVQLTSLANAAVRRAKIVANLPRQWLEAGNRVEVWDWAKQGPAGKRKLWRLRRVSITLQDLLPPEDTHASSSVPSGSSEPS